MCRTHTCDILNLAFYVLIIKFIHWSGVRLRSFKTFSLWEQRFFVASFHFNQAIKMMTLSFTDFSIKFDIYASMTLCNFIHKLIDIWRNMYYVFVCPWISSLGTLDFLSPHTRITYSNVLLLWVRWYHLLPTPVATRPQDSFISIHCSTYIMRVHGSTYNQRIYSTNIPKSSKTQMSLIFYC